VLDSIVALEAEDTAAAAVDQEDFPVALDGINNFSNCIIDIE
jgi:hypothetical protein